MDKGKILMCLISDSVEVCLDDFCSTYIISPHVAITYPRIDTTGAVYTHPYIERLCLWLSCVWCS